MYWIFILFLSMLMLLEWKKVDELAHNTIFTGSPSLENFGLKNTISF